MTNEQEKVWVEFLFPLWVVIKPEIAEKHGLSNAVHGIQHITQQHEKQVHLQTFTTEENAASYIKNRLLTGYEPSCVDGRTDFRIILERFRNNGGTHVRIDDPDGKSKVHSPKVGDVIASLEN